MIIETELFGLCQIDLDTEIKYNVVNARYDGADLLILKFKKSEDEKDNKRLIFCASKVLRALKKNGSVQLFITDAEAVESSTEASYLINKYPEVIKREYDGYSVIFVKL